MINFQKSFIYNSLPINTAQNNLKRIAFGTQQDVDIDAFIKTDPLTSQNALNNNKKEKENEQFADVIRNITNTSEILRVYPRVSNALKFTYSINYKDIEPYIAKEPSITLNNANQLLKNGLQQVKSTDYKTLIDLDKPVLDLKKAVKLCSTFDNSSYKSTSEQLASDSFAAIADYYSSLADNLSKNQPSLFPCISIPHYTQRSSGFHSVDNTQDQSMVHSFKYKAADALYRSYHLNPQKSFLPFNAKSKALQKIATCFEEANKPREAITCYSDLLLEIRNEFPRSEDDLSLIGLTLNITSKMEKQFVIAHYSHAANVCSTQAGKLIDFMVHL